VTDLAVHGDFSRFFGLVAARCLPPQR